MKHEKLIDLLHTSLRAQNALMLAVNNTTTTQATYYGLLGTAITTSLAVAKAFREKVGEYVPQDKLLYIISINDARELKAAGLLTLYVDIGRYAGALSNAMIDIYNNNDAEKISELVDAFNEIKTKLNESVIALAGHAKPARKKRKQGGAK